MGKAALRTSRFAPLAAGLALAATVGCAPAADPDCTPPTAPTPAPPRTAPSPALKAARSPDGAPHTLSGDDAPPIVVTIANASDEHVVAVDAVHGSLDEPIVLLSSKPGFPGAAAAQPEDAKATVAIAISDAFLGGEPPVRMRLVDALTGEDVTAVSMRPGQHAYLRLAGEGFVREATYRASLTIFDAQPAVYRVRIRSTAPHRPLGLRAAKWADTFADVPIFRRLAVSVILPVDSPGEEAAPYHVVVRSETPGMGGMSEDAKPLPACGISAQRLPRDGAILLSLPALEPGRYTGVIEIQGEPLAVDITLKNQFWWVWLLVAAGAGLSLSVREYVRYRAAREATERKIGAKEREIERKRDGLFAWDELEARNVLRLARGTKTYLGLQDVDDILADATPRERAERVAIDKALSETPLPSPLRAKLRAQFEVLSYLSSRDDAQAIDRGLAGLSRAAQEGFSSALQGWLGELESEAEAAQARILRGLEDAALRDDAKAAERTRSALRVIGLLIEDARALLLDSGLSAGQAEMLSSLGPALAQIEAWVREKRVPQDIVAMIHCDFRAVAQPRELDDDALPAPSGLRLRARGVEPDLNAHEEITFELVARDGALEELPPVDLAQPVAWWIDGTCAVARGGSRLTFVFPSFGLWGLRPRVEARVNKRVLAVWQGRVLPPQRSVAVVERLWASGARLGATFVGVIVAGAVAVAVYWSGKAFGGWADYIAAVMTGLGADLTVVAGGGKLLQSVLDTLQKRKED